MAKKQRSPWFIYISLLVANFTIYESMAFQATAIPSIVAFFEISVGNSAFIQTCFYLGCTVFMPIFGRVADVFGRRRILLIAMVVFAISEALAALSPNFPVFLFARFIQGLATAAILPAAIAYARLLFPTKGQGKALGTYTLFSSIGALTGAFISGLLVDTFGWPSIYWCSMLIAVAGFLIVFFIIPETERSEGVSYDFAGAMAMFIGIGCILILPNVITFFGFQSIVFSLVITGAILGLVAFWIIEGKVSHPIMDKSVLKSRAFIIPGLVICLAVVVMNGTVYMLSFFLQRAMGFNASQTAFVLMFLYIGTGSGAFLSGWLMEKLSPRYLINSGIILGILGVFLFSHINPDTPTWYIIISVMILGFGVVSCVPAVNKTGISVMHPSKMGAGAGALSTMKELGSPLGSAFSLTVFGTLTSIFTAASLVSKARDANLPESIITRLEQLQPGDVASQELMDQLSAHGISYAELQHAANIEGMFSAVHDVSLILLALAVLVFLLSLAIPVVRPAYNSK
ncbi:MAG: MFS transporter [Coriobacteriia bacterium]|nr:MFS transporter [Coriobacteriia bacterium]